MAKHFLYYAGLDKASGIEQIGVAVSDDLKTWARPKDAPIIPLRSTGDADALQTSNPCVLFEDGLFRMWYQGKGIDRKLSICYAESSDGITWKAAPEPVLAPAVSIEGYRQGYQQPHVLHDGGIYRMWFTSQDKESSSFSYAESSDGKDWDIIREEAMRPDAAWEGTLLYYPFVRKMPEGWEMWYTSRTTGRTWTTGRAYSTDGLSWKKDVRNPIIPKHPHGMLYRALSEMVGRVMPNFFAATYGIGSPNVREMSGMWYMFTHDSGVRHRLSISSYRSRDGDTWESLEHGLLQKKAQGWDAYFQADPFLLTV